MSKKLLTILFASLLVLSLVLASPVDDVSDLHQGRKLEPLDLLGQFATPSRSCVPALP